MKSIFVLLSRILSENIAFAHCDIPCGIYDPHMAQMAAHTVIRMTQLLSEKTEMHDVARIVHVKEEHGEIVEEELGTLENDYFKEEHFKENANLKPLIEKAVKLSIKTRQTVDLDSAKELLETILQISEIFFKTKGVTPVRIKSVYPTEGEIVTYK